MKLTLESTNTIVALEIGGVDCPARVWQGVIEDGVEVHAYVTRIAIPREAPAEVHARFAASLNECADPTTRVRALPLRMIL
jgi:hypothetical protein